MHTYAFDPNQKDDGQWTVGYWHNGLWKNLVRVNDEQSAVDLVNCLNGGSLVDVAAVAH